MIYQWAGVVTMYGGQVIDNQAVMASNRFLEMGVERYPDEWLLAFMLGCNYRFEMIPETEEQAAEWRVLGAGYLRQAAQLPGAPPRLALTASRILDRYGEAEQGSTLATEAFLSRRVLQTGTLDLSLSLQRNLPNFGAANGDLRALIAAGLRLRRYLPDSEWFNLLEYRRRLMADHQSDAGFLRWPLRLLTFGDSDNRVSSVSETTLDGVFHLTLAPVYGL